MKVKCIKRVDTLLGECAFTEGKTYITEINLFGDICAINGRGLNQTIKTSKNSKWFDDHFVIIEGEVDTEMKASDLKTGMIVVTRNGRKYVFLDNLVNEIADLEKVFLSNVELSWNNFNVDDNFININGHDGYDIMEVYSPVRICGISDFFIKNSMDGYSLIWKRKSKEEIDAENLVKCLQKQLDEANKRLDSFKK